MSAQRVDSQPAYVIHARPYRETSLLIEALTLDHGRVGLVARGAARPKSALRALLQPFVPLHLSWQGNGELKTLRSAEPAGMVRRPDGRAALSGLYLNELLQRLLPRDDGHPELFSAYVDAMQGLIFPESVEVCLRRFEMRLLDALGYGLVLDHEPLNGEAIVPEAAYDYDPHGGPRRTSAGLGLNLRGASLANMAANRFDDETTRADAKRLLRQVLRTHLGERPLKSRELFQGLAARKQV
ncbi:MAG: DNA repair protein RecO [Gammaproteobacteria bacterium]|nr:DNA repair protein RecO [Gammaproteobacteria bacterium]MCP5137826.1 DNA repair protein RecO [Gammaproteobacteria bacterium]